MRGRGERARRRRAGRTSSVPGPLTGDALASARGARNAGLPGKRHSERVPSANAACAAEWRYASRRACGARRCSPTGRARPTTAWCSVKATVRTSRTPVSSDACSAHVVGAVAAHDPLGLGDGHVVRALVERDRRLDAVIAGGASGRPSDSSSGTSPAEYAARPSTVDRGALVLALRAERGGDVPDRPGRARRCRRRSTRPARSRPVVEHGRLLAAAHRDPARARGSKNVIATRGPLKAVAVLRAQLVRQRADRALARAERRDGRSVPSKRPSLSTVDVARELVVLVVVQTMSTRSPAAPSVMPLTSTLSSAFTSGSVDAVVRVRGREHAACASPPRRRSRAGRPPRRRSATRVWGATGSPVRCARRGDAAGGGRA